MKIPNYWATVNCGVYFAASASKEAMDRSFAAVVPEPNDELLWASVLLADVERRPEYWWGPRVAHVWSPQDFEDVGPETYFAHVRHLEWADDIRRVAEAGQTASS